MSSYVIVQLIVPVLVNLKHALIQTITVSPVALVAWTLVKRAHTIVSMHVIYRVESALLNSWIPLVPLAEILTQLCCHLQSRASP